MSLALPPLERDIVSSSVNYTVVATTTSNLSLMKLSGFSTQLKDYRGG